MPQASPFPVEVYADTDLGLLHGTLSYETATGFELKPSLLSTAVIPEDASVDLQGEDGKVYKLIGIQARSTKNSRTTVYSASSCLFSWNSAAKENFLVRSWGYPYDEIFDDQPDLRQAHIRYEKDKEILELEHKKLLKFKVPEWNAEGFFRMGYYRQWTHPGNVLVEPKGSIVIEYSKPTNLATVLNHEERLREVLDLIMHRKHSSESIWLRGEEGDFDFFRQDSFGSQKKRKSVYLSFNHDIIWPYLGKILEIWCKTDERRRRPMTYLLSVIRNGSALPKDFRFWMSMQALEAWHDSSNDTKSKLDPCATCGKIEPGALLKSKLAHYERYWQYKVLKRGRSLNEWLQLMVNTRHDITHLSKSPEKTLQGVERTEAMNDLFVVLRACLLEHFAVDQENIDAYARKVFEQMGQMEFAHP